MNKLIASDLDNKTIDVHTHSTGILLEHLLKGRYPIVQDIVDLSNTVKLNGIDYAITFPMPLSIYYDSRSYWDNNQLLPSKLCDFPYQAENSTLLQSIEEFNLSNLLPFLSVSTAYSVPEQIQFILDLNDKYPIYGLKYHSTMDCMAVSDDRFIPFVELASDLDIPIMIHTKMDSTASPMHLFRLLEKYPNVRICAAHAAKLFNPFFEELTKNDFPNLFIDCAPFLRICNIQSMSCDTFSLNVDYENPVKALQCLVELAPRRWLWGTDTPWNRFSSAPRTYSTYADEVSILQKCGLSKLFSENTKRFLFGNT